MRKQPPPDRRWKQWVSRLGNYRQALTMFEEDPGLIALLWGGAHSCETRERTRVVDRLNLFFPRLKVGVVQQFIKGALEKALPEGTFAEHFYRELAPEGIVHLAHAFIGMSEPTLCANTAQCFFAAESPALVEVFLRAKQQGVGSKPELALRYLISACLANKRKPTTCFPARTLRQEGIPARCAVREAEPHELNLTLRDPKGDLHLTVIPWIVPLSTTPTVYRELSRLVEAIAGYYQMPEGALSLIRQASQNAATVRSEIEHLWAELQQAARCEGGLSIRRWLPPNGLSTMEVKLAGSDGIETGLREVAFKPERCPLPQTGLVITWLRFGWSFLEPTQIGPDGFLDILSDYREGADAWALRLLLNLIILRKLHCLSTRPAAELPSKLRSEAYGGGEGRAVLPHIRRLPFGYGPSAEALARAEEWGLQVPEGATVAGSPPLRTRSTNPELKPIVLKVEVDHI